MASEQTPVERGGGGGTMDEVILKPGEWIKRIEGSYRPEVISSLKFVTNTGSVYNSTVT